MRRGDVAVVDVGFPHRHAGTMDDAYYTELAAAYARGSLPSKDGDNPEHIRLFDARSLSALFGEAGAGGVSVDYVLNHMICMARL